MNPVNPFVFIVGCPRSGTTLLRHMVGAHPQMAVTPEAHWIAKWYEKRRNLTPEGKLTAQFIPDLLTNPKFELFHLGQEDLVSILRPGESMSYASFLSAVFDRYGHRLGK